MTTTAGYNNELGLYFIRLPSIVRLSEYGKLRSMGYKLAYTNLSDDYFLLYKQRFPKPQDKPAPEEWYVIEWNQVGRIDDELNAIYLKE